MKVLIEANCDSHNMMVTFHFACAYEKWNVDKQH